MPTPFHHCAWTCIRFVFAALTSHHWIAVVWILADGTAAGAEQRGCEEEQAEEEGASCMHELNQPNKNNEQKECIVLPEIAQEYERTSDHLLVLSLQAYVQQLETSRIRLQQVEHDLQRARSQVRSQSLRNTSGGLMHPHRVEVRIIQSLMCHGNCRGPGPVRWGVQRRRGHELW